MFEICNNNGVVIEVATSASECADVMERMASTAKDADSYPAYFVEVVYHEVYGWANL